MLKKGLRSIHYYGNYFSWLLDNIMSDLNKESIKELLESNPEPSMRNIEEGFTKKDSIIIFCYTVFLLLLVLVLDSLGIGQ